MTLCVSWPNDCDQHRFVTLCLQYCNGGDLADYLQGRVQCFIVSDFIVLLCWKTWFTTVTWIKLWPFQWVFVVVSWRRSDRPFPYLYCVSYWMWKEYALLGVMYVPVHMLPPCGHILFIVDCSVCPWPNVAPFWPLSTLIYLFFFNNSHTGEHVVESENSLLLSVAV